MQRVMQNLNQNPILWQDLLKRTGQRPNTTDKAFQAIREALLNGDLLPNQRLIEVEIAHKLGISRYPVHIALERLEATGYVYRRSGRGFIVASVTVKSIRNLFEIREAVESIAIGLACKYATEEQIHKAEKYHNNSLKFLPKKFSEAAQFIQFNVAFYSELLAACDNEHLLSLLKTYSMDQMIYAKLTRTFTARDWKTVFSQHQRIMDAVRQRNINRAENAVRRHVRTEMRIALKRLEFM
jgi:DNA-binding GntR family transcriptional regulator